MLNNIWLENKRKEESQIQKNSDSSVTENSTMPTTNL